MEETKKKTPQEADEMFYSKDAYKANGASMPYGQKAENESKTESMSELEMTKKELEETKKKLQEKEAECSLSKEKEEVAELLKEANIDPMVLDVVYVAGDIEATKTKIETLKSYVEEIKKNILKNYANAPLPLANKGGEYDPFIDGFDSNRF